MSTDSQRMKWRRTIAENFNRLSRVHERYRRRTDDRSLLLREKGWEVRAREGRGERKVGKGREGGEEKERGRIASWLLGGWTPLTI